MNFFFESFRGACTNILILDFFASACRSYIRVIGKCTIESCGPECGVTRSSQFLSHFPLISKEATKLRENQKKGIGKSKK